LDHLTDEVERRTVRNPVPDCGVNENDVLKRFSRRLSPGGRTMRGPV
jgi:hypothetical protein